MIKQSRLLRVLHGEKGLVPFWFMRQAGRYLPEYREVRKSANGFLSLCYTPALATEVTLQPIRRFGMDAAIIFSDILVVPHALGMHVWFEEGHGPRLTPLKSEADISALSQMNLSRHLAPVYEALRQTRVALPAETSLIGFAGSPWTLACYMFEGKSSKDFSAAKQFSKNHPEAFAAVLNILIDSIAAHLVAQVQAGADVVQLFDSWAGMLNEDEFRRFVITPTKAIVAKFKQSCPQVPVIGFPRLAGTLAKDYAMETGVDGISIDAEQNIQWAETELLPHVAVQGNLDNTLLADHKDAALAQTQTIIDTLGAGRFIFNLGHGVLPHTPIEHVQAVCDTIRRARGDA